MKQAAVLVIALSCAAAHAAPASPEAGGDRGMTFAVGKGGKLDVSIHGGNIIINTWEKDQVWVKLRDVDDDAEGDITMTQNGSTIVVEDSRGTSEDFTVEVSLPSRFDARLHTASGDIDINGNLTGRLRGSTGGGDIRLGNLGGTIDMKTSGGNIDCGDIGGDLDLATSGGDIRMGTVSGSAHMSTSGGDITVSNVGKRISATTSGGNISLGNVGGEANASTAGGDVNAGFVSGSATLSTAGGNVVLHGSTGTVRATSAGGDLQLGDVSGPLEGTTAGGNIVATLNPTKGGKSRLSTAGGDIRLVVPENAKATINARIRVSGWWRSMRDTYDIRSDFKMDKYEKDDHSREIRATILLNGGGEQISLNASMGNIEIRKQ